MTANESIHKIGVGTILVLCYGVEEAWKHGQQKPSLPPSIDLIGVETRTVDLDVLPTLTQYCPTPWRPVCF